MHRTRDALSLLAVTSGGHMPTGCHAQLEPYVSIAAGIVAAVQGERDSSPAARAAAHAQTVQAGTDSMIVVLLRLIAVRVVGEVGEVVRDGALICEQHQTRAR